MLRLDVRPLENKGQAPWEGIPPWLERLLRLRNVETEEEAKRFLKPELSQLLSPFQLSGMDKAVEILKKARQTGHFPNIGEKVDSPYQSIETRCGRLYGLFAADSPDAPNQNETSRIAYL